VQWASGIAKESGIPQAMVAAVEFLSSDLEEKLEFYSSIPGVVCVREHVLKSKNAAGPNLLEDERWLKKLDVLKRYRFKCAIVVFANQLSDLCRVYRRFPEIQFTLPLMGWPDDRSKEGFEKWKKEIRQLAQCSNFQVGISAFETIFGMDWNVEQVRPWVLEAIETFGPQRCMFGSHMPIAKLSRGFKDVYDAYTKIAAKFSSSEKEALFYRSAAKWFSL
jgi:predicted TIM-barrel fold metal-dependent hydrolase